MKIKVSEAEYYWRCGDGCCDNFETVSVFHLLGEEYEYRSHDAYNNLKEFLKDHFDLDFEIDYEGLQP